MGIQRMFILPPRAAFAPLPFPEGIPRGSVTRTQRPYYTTFSLFCKRMLDIHHRRD